jgi:beta-glucosidase/6-phospho-beta-glucosidase/beta-galactosidase
MNRIMILLGLWLASHQAIAADLRFPEEFVFGIATAPAQTEDGLHDIWEDWGRAGKIRAYPTHLIPEVRNGSWSHPERDLEFILKLKVQAVRLGVDWGRVMPAPDRFDESAILGYRAFIHSLKAHQIRIMLTLSHHSVPKWIQEKQGWLNPETKSHFVTFSKRMIQEFKTEVDWWITFNEPQIFSILAYKEGIWPPGERDGFTSFLNLPFYQGNVIRSLQNQIAAHQEVYDFGHQESPKIKIGIAQHSGFHRGATLLGRMIAPWSGDFMNWYFLDAIREKMDFTGMNYYGAEWISGKGIETLPDEEYSEAGRAVYPEGLYRLIKEAHLRYSRPIFITENGIADSTDWIRPAYLSEHLAAVHKALQEKIPVSGYFQWTLSDNLEWSDGYCPKFGLTEVVRDQHLARIPRASFFLYQEMARSHTLTQIERSKAWSDYQMHVGQDRPYCRSDNGLDALDAPSLRKIPLKDWRFP